MHSDGVEQYMNTSYGRFRAYAIGPCYASACTSMTDVDATAQMNTDHPEGAWVIATENFANGDPNGRPCNRRPDTHRHILFTC